MNKSKHKLLEDEGYQYNFDREIYSNKKHKKIFTKEVVDDHNKDWLLERITASNGTDWTIYSGIPLKDKIKKEILNEVDK